MDASILQNSGFLQLVLNALPFYVFWKDNNCIYRGCNSRFAESAGFQDPQEIIGKSDYDLPWSKKQSDFFRKIDREVMDSGKCQINFEETQTINGGSIRWLSTSKIPLKGNTGKIIGILGMYEDITERKQLELDLILKNENLSKLNSSLELKNDDLEHIAYSTSHDLQEPLRMIGGFVQLLERKFSDKLNSEGIEYINYVKEGTTRMSSLINQILLYSKIQEVEEKFKEIKLASLLQEVKQNVEDAIGNKNFRILNNLPDQSIVCQPQRVKMLFCNIVMNGIKFNKSEVPVVEINFEDKEKEWQFSIADNGIGIDEQYQDMIFKPFKRLNSRNKFEGNGIGLSICKKVIYLHGGKIFFQKNQAGGSTFYFTLSKQNKVKVKEIIKVNS